MVKRNKRPSARETSLGSAAAVLKRHFAGLNVANLITTNREYPAPARVDLQRAIDELLPRFSRSRQLGIHAEYAHETLTMGHLLANQHARVVIGPLQYEEIDVGETLTVPCVRRALWITRDGRLPFALVIGQAARFGMPTGTNIEVAVPPGEKGAELARSVLDSIEIRVKAASSYRGKVLSLETANQYNGAIGPIRVHKLKQVTSDQLVLPQRTVALLDRNVIGFIAQRERLKSLGLAAKKGLLFYGPPGTGKTYTIHYLATRLPNHTTFLITAEQVGLLEHYFQLARFLQPSIVVIEDVDLIARTRENMNSPCEEALLNKLLNEMDGLREDAEILFVLTTNRPDQLEKALASRPGRIDQAIEFPLPDEEGRRQLAHLYAYGLKMESEVVELVVRRTAGGSAALIKELMRRAAQFLLESGHRHLEPRHIDAALEEMLFSGGSLNANLLGAIGVQQPR
jgi:hypothetical protein